MVRGQKMALLHPYKYREVCEGFEYTETIAAGTLCEYVTKRKGEGFIPQHKLKHKYIESNWDVLANEGLIRPAGHVIKMPLPECNSFDFIIVNDEFLNHYFGEAAQE